MDERLNHLLDEATGSLQDDPELRLEVRATLVDRLPRDEEGIEPARVNDLAAELLAANKPRLHRRAFTRRLMQRVLLPAAILIALWVGYASYTRMTGITTVLFEMLSINSQMGISSHTETHDGDDFGLGVLASTLRPFYRYHSIWEQWTDTDRKMTATGIPRSCRQDMPAIVMEHSNDKRYWGYYARSFGYPQSTVDVAVLCHGKEVDPDNALYHYLLASDYLPRAVEEAPKASAPSRQFIVKDAALLKKGIMELREGMTKPYLRSYVLDMRQERFARLPRPTMFEGYLLRTQFALDEPFPERSCARIIAEKIPFLAEYAIAHAQRDDVQILRYPVRISEQLARDSDTIFLLYAARNIAVDGANEPAAIADRIGRHDWARQLRDASRRFQAAMPAGVTVDKQVWASPERRMLWTSGGMLITALARSDVSAQAHIQLDELAPSRALDYWIIDRLGSSILLWLFTLMMAGTALCWGVWSFVVRKKRKVALLLLPTGKALLRIVLYGTLLPLGVYVLYSNIPALSGREYSLLQTATRVLIEQMIMITALLLLPLLLARRYFKQRCKRLGISTSGTVARSLLSVFAMVIILLALITQSCLHGREARLLEEDRLIFLRGNEAGATPMENRAIESIKTKLFQ